ncbi:hypothetical protein M3202_20350 [Alkalihalobacillus oceani]|uniref:Uncharacterized protein n=1 Tax=Halalkalibacter oceani TaxID=1653776 RepID=A0A9X2DTJ0_9BACI|nr:hypothetical protein [Halalkalibacter oceani]MCM3716401.1 hypothetical protein [Halalkalibacter oceani]
MKMIQTMAGNSIYFWACSEGAIADEEELGVLEVEEEGTLGSTSLHIAFQF